MACRLNKDVKDQEPNSSEYYPLKQGQLNVCAVQAQQKSLQSASKEISCIQRIAEHAKHEKNRSILREDRFNSNISLRISSFVDQYHGGVFLSLTAKYFMATYSYPTFEQLTRAQRLSGKVAEGIIDEGWKMNEIEIAKKMADQINQVKDGTENEIWECFIRLYCMDSFLYRRLNEIMRQAADQPDMKLWESSIPIFGSFAYVLWRDGPVCTIKDMTVYRGICLTDEDLEQYQKNCPNIKDSRLQKGNNSFDLKKPKFYSSSIKDKYIERRTFSFPAFTSTSRCRSKAEQFGNSLLIIKINKFSGWDVSCYSEFNEEEHLLKPGLRFWIQSCIFDEIKNKWIIHLECKM
jgi:hypothetical protein